jgi:hypothetical protein
MSICHSPHALIEHELIQFFYWSKDDGHPKQFLLVGGGSLFACSFDISKIFLLHFFEKLTFRHPLAYTCHPPSPHCTKIPKSDSKLKMYNLPVFSFHVTGQQCPLPLLRCCLKFQNLKIKTRLAMERFREGGIAQLEACVPTYPKVRGPNLGAYLLGVNLEGEH